MRITDIYLIKNRQTPQAVSDSVGGGRILRIRTACPSTRVPTKYTVGGVVAVLQETGEIQYAYLIRKESCRTDARALARIMHVQQHV